ncbi:MAG: CBS domain-containing protein [Chloroflexota bacterium]|jgi:CBS domain-containing protein
MIKARDIMTKEVVTVKPSTTVEELAGLLVAHKISGAPVVDEKGHLVGIVTENDLISQNKRLHIPTVARLFDAYIVLGSQTKIEREIKRMAAATVDEICVRKVITVSPDAPLDEIATIMAEKKVHLLPVVEGKKLLGIIGKIDLIRAMSKE